MRNYQLAVSVWPEDASRCSHDYSLTHTEPIAKLRKFAESLINQELDSAVHQW